MIDNLLKQDQFDEEDFVPLKKGESVSSNIADAREEELRQIRERAEREKE